MVAHATINTGRCDAAAAATATTKSRPVVMPPARSNHRSACRKNSGSNKEMRRRMRRCVEVRRKMEALRSLVPGAAGAGAGEDAGEELLFRVADYIARLQVQVKVMQLMVDVLEHTKD
uniref:BHLH domain-containing protein n=1 Tax=Oryza punctata TaxID=4537 RepID=A0A0E0KYQ7_ORYPU